MEKEDKLSFCGFFFDIDLFGSDVDIYYKGRPKRNSWIGRIFTILYMGIYIFFFIFRFIRMINKEDVTFYDTNAYNGKPPYMLLNKERFSAGFALIHPGFKKPFIDPTIFNAKMFYYSGVKNGFSFDYNISDVPIEVCNINHFGSNYKELFSKKELGGYFCVKNLDKVLQGHQAHEVYSYYNIKFYPCVNTTENKNICAPPEMISLILNKFGVSFIMQDVDLTPQDYKNPIKHSIKEITVTVASDLLMEIFSFLQVVNIETDEDIFGLGTSTNIKKEKYLKYDQSQRLYSTNILNLTNPNSSLVSVNIGLSEIELTQTRTYPKLVAVIGDVGGFMEVIFSGFSLLAAILTETLYQKSLVNHLFSFDLDKKLVLVKQKDIKPLKKTTSINTFNPDKLLKKPTINNIFKSKEKNINNEDMKKTYKQSKNNDLIIKKSKDLNISRTKKNLLVTSKKTSFSSIYDMKMKSFLNSKDNGNFKNDISNRKLNSKNNIFKVNDIDIKIIPDKAENENENERNIITNIELNQFKPKFCYKKKREHFENILLEEGMKIILKKLDVQNLFKKIYKDNPEIDKKNTDSEYIEMSEFCKKELRNVLDGQVQTLII